MLGVVACPMNINPIGKRYRALVVFTPTANPEAALARARTDEMLTQYLKNEPSVSTLRWAATGTIALKSADGNISIRAAVVEALLGLNLDVRQILADNVAGATCIDAGTIAVLDICSMDLLRKCIAVVEAASCVPDVEDTKYPFIVVVSTECVHGGSVRQSLLRRVEVSNPHERSRVEDLAGFIVPSQSVGDDEIRAFKYFALHPTLSRGCVQLSDPEYGTFGCVTSEGIARELGFYTGQLPKYGS